ncbi:DNA-binding transcriptional LysR family regulator [Lipingzhangella halophila]|uniref:DNA-binding transcriptional LysR family regulator n=1 Tax=Lipingzhangella halophila TaxID=1783352 RepID=A0A7W7RGY7_9ACTN|nr:LysR family transcriptional regulator [Lipingzhangella halophila]MBB4931448.1 DNA-binding transcriptional LysR family regulator [Lipingzhangella halophila]
MDLVAACNAFVYVSEHGSFTQGAAAARIPQPVASRRIAALERHLGARLFDRSTRQAVLTPFGRDMFPSARRLVQLVAAMEESALSARRAPLRVAVPDTCARLDLARLIVEARRHGVYLDPLPAAPEARTDLLRSQEVRAALVAVPPGEATWRVPLGLAGASPPSSGVMYLETLRAGRAAAGQRPRRVWIQPEDDVPHIRDRMTRIRDTSGLRPTQVTVAHSLTTAAAETLDSDDLLLASGSQATELGLYWSRMGETTLTRGLDVATTGGEDPERLRTALRECIARCVGAVAADEAAR